MQLKSHDHLLIKIFESVCDGYDSAAILDRKGQVFHLKYETLADLGTLSPAALTALKYFPLAKGDLVILNDPYSGGTVLSTVSLVTALNENLILIARQGFRPRLNFAQKLDEEGLRIPPTPLATKFQIAVPILDAMSEHPLAPESFKGRLQHFCDKIFATVHKFSHVDTLNSSLLMPQRLEGHLERTRKRMLEVLGDEAQGEASTESELSSGELLKVHLELHADGIKVNFSGTKTSKRMCLTDAASFGAVLGALLAFLQKPIPINGGLLSLIQVESPLGCFLNAKYPSPTFLGMTEGTSFVAQTVLRALKALSPKNEVAEPATLPLMLNFDFGGGQSFFESLPGGAGATSQQNGCDAVHFWVRNRLEPSVEEIERRFPILIRRFGVFEKSGGQGQLRGGHGMTKVYELMAPATLSFLCTQEKIARRGLKGGLDGIAAEIYIVNIHGQKTAIHNPQGQMELSPGNKIFVNSSGGGGYGRSPTGSEPRTS
jgi:N-methylhydantoinase B